MYWVISRLFDAVALIPQRFWGFVWTLVKVSLWALPAYCWFLLYRNGIQMFLETDDESARQGLLGLGLVVTAVLLPLEMALLLASYEFHDLRRSVRRVMQEFGMHEPRSVAEGDVNHQGQIFMCWCILWVTPFSIAAALGLGSALS